MRKTILMTGALAMALGGAALAGAEQGAVTTSGAERREAHGTAASASHDLHAHVVRSAGEMQAMPMTGDIDHDFMASMRKHHQDGIRMAEIALRSAKDPAARSFAQKVIDEQTRDLSKLDAWLKKHSRDQKQNQGRESPQR